MKKLVMTALVAVAAMVGVSHAANADALDDIKKSGKIRIAIDLGVPPYLITATVIGVLAQRLARTLCPVCKAPDDAHAAQTIEKQAGFEVDLLELSHLADEPWKVIHPCKACVSTSMALCHWPCSCYPNHAMGQTNDWMAELYPRWVAAHGVLVLCPVHWYQAPASLKLMMDRLVCADGGNPDPTTTRGKDPAAAKVLELAGWPYPRHPTRRSSPRADSPAARTVST